MSVLSRRDSNGTSRIEGVDAGRSQSTGSQTTALDTKLQIDFSQYNYAECQRDHQRSKQQGSRQKGCHLIEGKRHGLHHNRVPALIPEQTEEVKHITDSAVMTVQR